MDRWMDGYRPKELQKLWQKEQNIVRDRDVWRLDSAVLAYGRTGQSPGASRHYGASREIQNSENKLLSL